MDNSVKNRRIARNTFYLYIRTFVTILVSLYTSRVVLDLLGEQDVGIYEIVGGVVILFSFFKTSMTISTQRFLNFEMGRGGEGEVGKVFSMSMTAHLLIAGAFLLLAETVGLWFVNHILEIPPERMYAANRVYQFSVATLILSIVTVPYNALVIAHERMSFFAFLSIIESVMKLGVVFLLMAYGGDKLIGYAFLLIPVNVLLLAVYKIYCQRRFKESRYRPFWDGSLFRKLISFSGWTFFGGMANAGSQQGGNILLNVFHGVTTNSAVYFANKLSTAIYAFIFNVQTAFQPQMVQAHASGDRDYFMSLIFRMSKFSYYLLLIMAVPVMLNTEFILSVWLREVPEFTAQFCRWIMVFLLIDAISAPLWVSVQATGRIRNYQILISVITLLNIPVAYLALMNGAGPVSVFVVRAGINLLLLGVRIIYLKGHIDLPVRRYVSRVVMICIMVTLLSVPLPYWLSLQTEGWVRLISTTALSLAVSGLIIYIIGLSHVERQAALRPVRRFFGK